MKEINDLLNWVKSELSECEHPKIGKTQNPYRFEKKRFLTKFVEVLEKLQADNRIKYDCCDEKLQKTHKNKTNEQPRNIKELIRNEITRAFKYGQDNARMMESGLERDETDDYVNYRMISINEKMTDKDIKNDR